jgi:hypothetical protein
MLSKPLPHAWPNVKATVCDLAPAVVSEHASQRGLSRASSTSWSRAAAGPTRHGEVTIRTSE